MYLSIIVLPGIAAIISGFLGRKVGIIGSQIITCLSGVITLVLTMIAFFEVGLSESGVSISILSWIDSEYLDVR